MKIMFRFLLEIMKNKNYYGPGGFINTETYVFIWNTIVPIFYVHRILGQSKKIDHLRKNELKKRITNTCKLN